MDIIEKRFNRLLFASMAICFFDFIVGISLFMFTNLASKVCVVLMGSLILIHGIFYFIRYIYDGLGSRFFAFDLIVGVAATILGLFCIFNPFDAISVIGIFFGIWMFITGAEKIYYGVRFYKNGDSITLLTLFIAGMLMIMGLLSVFNPFKLFMLITRLIGLFMICYGLLEIMINHLYYRRGKELLKMFD